MTRTILGGCPNCGAPKENPVYFEPRIAPSGSWWDDFSWLQYALWGTAGVGLLALVIVALVVEWEIGLGIAAVLALAAYVVNELDAW